MPVQLLEPVYRILRAQQANIARITTDIEVDGTTGRETVLLWGPAPNVVRLYDTPLRFYQDAAIEAWERIITLNPVFDEDAGRIIGRNDRTVSYQVQFLVRLTEAEMAADRGTSTAGVLADAPLAEKAHKLIYDWHHVFHDDLHLETDDCPQGLVDDATYRMRWDPGVEWPFALFVAEVTASRSGW